MEWSLRLRALRGLFFRDDLGEIFRETGLRVRWGPGTIQIADGLTKDKEDAAMKMLFLLKNSQIISHLVVGKMEKIIGI